jgi:hypothetical protein
MQYQNLQLVTNGDMSQASITSSVLDMSNYVLASIQAVFTGSPVGVFKIQRSNDKVTFSDDASSVLSISSSGDWVWEIASVGSRYARLVYTKTSGTGTLNVVANEKGGL